MLKKLTAGLIMFAVFNSGLQINSQENNCPEGQWRVNSECQSPEALNLVDGWNTVKPGEGTMCAHGTEYQFWVRPGNEDLLVYLQGGGACLNEEMCQANSRAYIQTAGITSIDDGVFDTENEQNPFRDHTIVRMPSCTGDTYMGTKYTEYSEDVAVYHHGFINATAVLDFIEDVYPSPQSIFVTGCSAGSNGSAILAPYLIEQYPGVPLVQLGDSLGAIFGNPEDLANMWGADASIAPWLDVDTEQFTSAAYYIALANYYPGYTFSQFNTQYDQGQQRFFGDPEETANLINQNIGTIADSVDNFRYYIAGGNMHCILPSNQLYQATVGDTLFVDWLTDLAQGNDVPNTSCEDCDHMERQS